MIIRDASAFLKTKQLPLLDNYRSGSFPMGVQPTFSLCLSFIRSFVRGIYLQELHSPLKLVLIDGAFYKEQNREEYNEAYSGILRSADDISRLDGELSPQSQLRHDIDAAAKEMGAQKLLKKRIESYLEPANREAERIVNAFLEHVRLITLVLGGIVDGDMGGRYDTLSNLGYIGKNDNKNLLSRLRSIRGVLDKSMTLGRELYDIERSLGSGE